MSEQKKDAPAFDFYPERWLVGTAAMSDAEQLSYLRLLCHQWTMDGLPSDVATLKRLGGKGVTDAVVAKFPDCEGKRRNKRLEIVRQDQRSRIQKKSDQRKAAANARWAKSQCANDAGGYATALREDMRQTCPPPTTHHPPPTLLENTHPPAIPREPVSLDAAKAAASGAGWGITAEEAEAWWLHRSNNGWEKLRPNGPPLPITAENWQHDLRSSKAWLRDQTNKSTPRQIGSRPAQPEKTEPKKLKWE